MSSDGCGDVPLIDNIEASVRVKLNKGPKAGTIYSGDDDITVFVA